MYLIATIIIALSAFTAEGFTSPSTHHARVETTLFDGKINTQIDLDSPKVATNTKLSQGDKAVYCRCWKSDTFPLCDGSHMAHNKETGDNVGPLILSAAASDGGVHVAVVGPGRRRWLFCWVSVMLGVCCRLLVGARVRGCGWWCVVVMVVVWLLSLPVLVALALSMLCLH